MILENLHNSQESWMPKACNLIKKESPAKVFSCDFCEISKDTFSYKTTLVAASENFKFMTHLYQNRCFHKFWTKLLYLYLQSYLYAMYEPEKLRVRSYRASKDLRHAGNVCARNISCEQIKKSFNILIFLYFEYLGIAWHLLF